MASPFAGPSRGRDKPRLTPLPTYAGAVEEKHHLGPFWHGPSSGQRGRRFPRLTLSLSGFFGRKRATTVLLLAVGVLLWLFSKLGHRHTGDDGDYEPPTLAFRRHDLQRIWLWELASGHYPSSRKIPPEIDFPSIPNNPGIPEKATGTVPPKFRPPPVRGALLSAPSYSGDSRGTGNQRTYEEIPVNPKYVQFPSRPRQDSVADLDVIMEHCDFNTHKFVRDCLEVLRAGAGLDVGTRVRRGKMDEWRYIYQEHKNSTTPPLLPKPVAKKPLKAGANPDEGLVFRKDGKVEDSIQLGDPLPLSRDPAAVASSPCDPNHPRLFHMFWTGPFTDKPYMLLMSFLYTQNLYLHTKPDPNVCRPEFWLWIKMKSAVAETSPNALREMYESLAENPWSAPFLHERFKDVIKFKLWDTTEQLDGIPEIRNDWREFKDVLFNAGGHIYTVPKSTSATPSSTSSTETEGPSGTLAEEIAQSPTALPQTTENNLFDRVGSKSATEYDRLSVVLSDMARFVLTHRFGGIYVDADTIFLRDWTELWNWKGAFAYRWSRLPKYNTAVLKLNKGSALGTFLFRTALRNGLDFHPMTVSTYTKDAFLEPLLLRLPDALFDAAWLNTEWYQRERPPMPYFTDFSDFFQTPQQDAAAPQAAGFDHFFRGSFSYHFHNQWWTPFDSARNWPDLGLTFIKGERQAREKLRLEAESKLREEASLASLASPGSAAKAPMVKPPTHPAQIPEGHETVADDKVDLPWTAVLKRTFEAFIRGDRPNMYGEWVKW